MSNINLTDPDIVDVKIINHVNSKLYINGGIYVPPLATVRLSDIRMSVAGFITAYPTSSLPTYVTAGGVEIFPIKSAAFTIMKPAAAQELKKEIANPFGDEVSPEIPVKTPELISIDPEAPLSEVLNKISGENTFGDENSDEAQAAYQSSNPTPETEATPAEVVNVDAEAPSTETPGTEAPAEPVTTTPPANSNKNRYQKNNGR